MRRMRYRMVPTEAGRIITDKQAGRRDLALFIANACISRRVCGYSTKLVGVRGIVRHVNRAKTRHRTGQPAQKYFCIVVFQQIWSIGLLFVISAIARHCAPGPLLMHLLKQGLQVLALVNLLNHASKVFISLGVGLFLKVRHVVFQPIALLAGLC